MNMYSFLATPDWLTGNAKTIAIAALAVVALVAIIVGAVKGFTRLNWGALVWGGACALFCLLELKFHDKNPILKMGAISGLNEGVRDFAAACSYALVSIFAALVLYGLLTLIFRPRKQKAGIRKIDEDEEEEDIDEDEEYERTENGGRSICLFNRICGAIVSLANAALVLVGIACLALVIVNVTPLRTGALQSVYESSFMEKGWSYIQKYTLDFVFIAIIAAIGYGGFRSGFIGGFRSVFLVVGYIAAIVVGFWLPFSKIAAEKEWLSFVGQLSGFLEKFIVKALPGSVAAVLGKIGCGLVLCVGLCVIVALLGLILRLIERGVRHTGVLRFVDGVLSTVVMLVLGVLVCALIVAILYILEYFGIFESSKLFDSASPLTKGLYSVFDEYLAPLFEKIKGKVN